MTQYRLAVDTKFSFEFDGVVTQESLLIFLDGMQKFFKREPIADPYVVLESVRSGTKFQVHLGNIRQYTLEILED